MKKYLSQLRPLERRLVVGVAVSGVVVLETTVVYVLCRIARWARTTRTASPARSGTIAFTPTPARYDPRMDRRRTISSSRSSPRAMRWIT